MNLISCFVRCQLPWVRRMEWKYFKNPFEDRKKKQRRKKGGEKEKKERNLFGCYVLSKQKTAKDSWWLIVSFLWRRTINRRGRVGGVTKKTFTPSVTIVKVKVEWRRRGREIKKRHTCKKKNKERKKGNAKHSFLTWPFLGKNQSDSVDKSLFQWLKIPLHYNTSNLYITSVFIRSIDRGGTINYKVTSPTVTLPSISSVKLKISNNTD